jgi:hypothetical protein
VTGPVQHDVRFYGRVRDYGPAGGEIVARCEPCAWSVALEGGHSIADLTRLARQHAGETVTTGVSRDGSATLSPADLLTALHALSAAREFCTVAERAAFATLAAQLGDDR